MKIEADKNLFMVPQNFWTSVVPIKKYYEVLTPEAKMIYHKYPY